MRSRCQEKIAPEIVNTEPALGSAVEKQVSRCKEKIAPETVNTEPALGSAVEEQVLGKNRS